MIIVIFSYNHDNLMHIRLNYSIYRELLALGLVN